MLDDLEHSTLRAIRRLTGGTYEPTDGQAVAEELERQGCRPDDDMVLNHLLRRLKNDGYISPNAYFGSEGLKAIVSVDLTAQGREVADGGAQPHVPSQSRSADSDSISAADPKKVMVVHGRDEGARRAMFEFLCALGLEPQEWSSLVAATGSAAPYIGQVLAKAFETAKAVVVLFTPDDEGWLKEVFQRPDDPPEETQPTPQARPNVLFEAGMALGVHPDRTVLVELGKLRPFSDIYGRHVIRLNGTEGPLREIARRLYTAGCAVNDDEVDWTAVRFPDRSVNGNTAEAGSMAASTVGSKVSQTPWRANPLVGHFKIRQFAAPVQHDEKATVFRVVIAADCEPAVDELNSAIKGSLREVLSSSSLEKWGCDVTGLLSSDKPTEWARTAPNSGLVATFERDWGVSKTQGSLLSGRATLQLPPGFQFGSRPALLLDIVERPVDAADGWPRLSLSLTSLYAFLHVLGRAAVDEIGSLLFPVICGVGMPAIVGPNYEISFGDRSLDKTVELPSTFERVADAPSNPWAEINTPENTDPRDLAARDDVIRNGLEKLLRSNGYDEIEDEIARQSALLRIHNAR